MPLELKGLISPAGPTNFPISIGKPGAKEAWTQVNVIVDTGASKTHVSPAFLEAMGLNPSGGTAKVHKPNGEVVEGNRFHVSVWTNDGNLIADNLEVIATTPYGCTVLIGQDLLSKCIMVHDGPKGSCTLTFGS